MSHADSDRLMLIPSELAVDRLMSIRAMLDHLVDGVEKAIYAGQLSGSIKVSVPVDVVYSATLVADLTSAVAYELHRGRAAIARCRDCDSVHLWTTGDGHREDVEP